MTQPQAPLGSAPSQGPYTAPPPYDAPTTPLAGAANRATCPICGTTFAPHDTDGKCPVCGEQVVRSLQVGGYIPVLSPAWQWLRQGANWRLIAVAALILYQIILFIALWIHLAQMRAL
ncbi:MAG: hypothetical protein ACHQ1E_01020 [Ktedonobacterales bacterium]